MREVKLPSSPPTPARHAFLLDGGVAKRKSTSPSLPVSDETPVAVRLQRTATTAANQGPSLAEAARACLKDICELMGWPLGRLVGPGQVAAAGDSRSSVWEPSDRAEFAAFRRGWEALRCEPGIGLAGRVLESAAPVWIGDLAESPTLAGSEIALDAGLRAALAVPILVGPEVAGVIELFARSPLPLDRALLDALGDVGVQLGRAVERERVEILRQSERKFLSVASSAVDAIISADALGTIAFWNHSAERIFGYSHEEIVGRPLTVIMPERYRSAHQAGLQRMAAGGPPRMIGRTIELHGLRKDGSEFPIELSLSTWQSNGDRGYTGIVRDITERKAAEEARQREAALIRVLLEVTLACNHATTVEAAAQTCLDSVCALKRWSVGHLYLASESTPEVLESSRIWHLDEPERFETFRRVSEATRFVPGVGLPGRVLQSGKPVRVPDVATDPNFPRAKLGLDLGVRSGFGFPVLIGSDVVGVLEFFSPEIVEPDPTFLEVVANIGTQLGRVIERRRAEEARRESEDRFRVMAQSAPVMLWLADGEGKPSFYNQLLLDFTGRTLEEELTDGWVRSVHPADLQRCVETYWTAFRDQREFRMEYRLRRADGEYRWLLDTGVPRVTPGGDFAGYIGCSVDITERKLREREHETLVTVTQALRAARTSVEMLPVVLDQVGSLFEAESQAILLRGEATGDLVIELARGPWSPLTGTRASELEPLMERVIESGEPYLNNELQADPLLGAHPSFAGLSAATCVPLISSNATLGVLWVGRRTPIDREELRLLVAIAEITASSLRRASLHEQTERRLRQLTALRSTQIAISGSLDLDLTLNILLQQITSLLRIDAAAVMLVDPATSMLEYAAAFGFHSSAHKRTRLHLGEGEAGQVVLKRRSRHVSDLRWLKDELRRSWMVDEEGFVAYHVVPLVAKGRVRGVLELFHRQAQSPTAEWTDFLEMLALQASAAIDSATMFDEVQQSNAELVLAYDKTLEGWSRALDLRDKETEGHTARVTEMTERLARALGMTSTEVVHARRGALLHDIGKMGIPDRILLKPGPLDPKEWETMRLHPVYAYELLSPVPFLRPALDIPYCHHEKWDGTGYPRGLKGDQIPAAARIFAVVDVWDAMRSDRPYHPPRTEEEVFQHILDEAGKHFDPRMVELFLAEMGWTGPRTGEGRPAA